MANEKRQTYKLASNTDYNKDISVTMASGADGSRMTITFMSREEAYDAKTGSKNELRDALASVIAARFEKNGIATQHRVADGYIAFSTSDSKAQSSQAMFSHAEEAIKNVSALSRGKGIKAALATALEQEKAATPGKAAALSQGPIHVPVKTALTKDDAAAAIMKGVELVMKKDDAKKLATALGNKLSTQFPTRPIISGDEQATIDNRNTLKDPLYRAIAESVSENVIPDSGKRHFAVGEVFDAVEAAYNGLGKATPVPVRKRA